MTVSHPDLEWRETVQGSKPGDRFVRVATHKGFTRVGRGHLVPRKGTGAPTTRLGRTLQLVSRVLFGRPLATREEPHERLNVFKGLPVFASDNISSSAYATEEIMRVLVLAGAGALALTMPITIVIVVVLAIVVISYQQTIRAYPNGGGSYIVASDNLGPLAGLTAAGALLTDYVLTVSCPLSNRLSSRNARIVLILMGSCFGSIFLGMSFLAGQMAIVPDPTEQQTVISQMTALLVGEGTPYHYLVQISTALLLVLAANTAFSDFPRLSSILARDRYVPRVFQFRGDRLAFTGGIVLLALIAGFLIMAFAGSVTNLIPLYTVGVFVAFTLSQSGMVRHHWRLRDEEAGWRWRAAINGLGAVTTGIVAIEVAISKFALGAWMVLVIVPILIGIMWATHKHYQRLEGSRRAETPMIVDQITVRAVVPVAELGVPARQALAYARAVAPDDAHVVAVHVTDDVATAENLRRQWQEWEPGVEMVIIESPYRSLTGPLLAYIDALKESNPRDTLTVVLPEYVPSHWWEHLLHNQTALRLKAALLFHPGIVVTNVPYHMAARPATAT